MSLTKPTLLVIFCATVLVNSSRGDVIFNNGTPLLTPVPAQGALFADPGNPGFSQAADDFSLAAGQNSIRDIHWWGTYGILTSDAFTINIYDNNAGTVGALNTSVSILSLARTATANTINGRAMYAYDAVISSVTLNPATTYWLGISNATGNVGSDGWAWVLAANSGNARQYSLTNGTWGNSSNKTLAFNLTNDVPEPSTYALLLAGLGALALFRVARRVRPSEAAA